MTDAEVLDAVAGEADWMEDLLVRLVEAPTVLGAEEEGQRLMEDGVRATAAWRRASVPLDAAALRARGGRVAVQLGRRAASATSSPTGSRRRRRARPLADPQRPRRRRPARGGGAVDAPAVHRAPRRRLALRPRRRRHEGRAGGDDRRRPRARPRRRRAGRARPAAVGRGGGVHRPRRAAVPARRRARRRVRDHRAASRPPHGRPGRRAVVPRRRSPASPRTPRAPTGSASTRSTRRTAVLDALRALEARLNADPPPPFDGFEHPINLNPGVIAGGDWPSTVAATCTLSCRLGAVPGAGPGRPARAGRGGGGRGGRRSRGARVRYDGFACEGAVVDDAEPVVTALGDAYARLHGERPALQATTATTDARHFVRAGIPAVCFGPRGERIHGIDERVSLRSVHGVRAGARALHQGLVRPRLEAAYEERKRRKSCRSSIQRRPRRRPRHGESGKLHRRALGVPDLVFFIVAASAPLTAVAGGQAATYLVTGNKGVPFMFIPLGIMLALFAVGYAAMSRHVAERGRVLRVRRAWSRQGRRPSARRSSR